MRLSLMSFSLPVLAAFALALPARADVGLDVKGVLDANGAPLSADVLVGLGEGLRLEPPSFIRDLVEGEALMQSRRGGQGGGSRVRVGAAPVSRGGASPMGKPFGIGLEIGAPTSLTLKYMLTGDQGLVGGLGAFGGFLYRRPTVSLYVDYLWHPHVLVWTPPFKLSWFIGGGAWLIFGNDFNTWWGAGRFYAGYSPIALNLRLPLGLNLALNELPIEFYLQAIPTLMVFPGIDLGIGASLGFRFYF